MGDVIGMGGDRIGGDRIGGPGGPVEPSKEAPKDHPFDVLSHRLTQAGAVLHALQQAARDGDPSAQLVDDTCWAATVLLEQAEAAAEEYHQLVRKGLK